MHVLSKKSLGRERILKSSSYNQEQDSLWTSKQSRFPANSRGLIKYEKCFDWSLKVLYLIYTNQILCYMEIFERSMEGQYSGVPRFDAGCVERLLGRYFPAYLFAYTYFSRFGSFIRQRKTSSFLCLVYLEMPWNYTPVNVRRFDKGSCINSIHRRRV